MGACGPQATQEGRQGATGPVRSGFRRREGRPGGEDLRREGHAPSLSAFLAAMTTKNADKAQYPAGLLGHFGHRARMLAARGAWNHTWEQQRRAGGAPYFGTPT